jgi:ribosome-binding factor A
MEHGGAKHHRERMAEALKDEISVIVEGELGDPRIGLASVTEVQLSPDGRAAQVYVHVSGEQHEAVQTLDGLNAAKNFIRRELTERLRLRQAPELFFQLDRSDQYGARIDELLQRIDKRKK